MITDLQSATRGEILAELARVRPLVARIECELRRRNDLADHDLHALLYAREHRGYEPSTTGEKP